MVKMSDILKMAKERKAKQQAGEVSAESSKQQQEAQPVAPQEQELKPSVVHKEKPKIDKKIERQPKPEIKISQSIMERTKLLNKEECIGLYKEAAGLMKGIYDKVRQSKDIAEKDKNINSFVETFVNQQSLSNDNILDLVNLPMEDNYIYSHVVNVCIISLEIGIGLKFGRAELMGLGFTAMLHDIGMMKVQDIYIQSRRLTTEEYNEIKRHTKYGAEILKKFPNIHKDCLTIVLQEHERIDGSGYPAGLHGDSVNKYAKIIGLADVYEAMTHSRPYRDKVHLWEVLKSLIATQGSFGKKLVKVLIQRNSCPYTLGSYVKLTSGEKGKVIKRNMGNPLRPIIEISYDADSHKLEETKTIDLSKYPTISIKDYLEREEVNA